MVQCLPCASARSFPLQPPTHELSSPRRLNQPRSRGVSSSSFVCARERSWGGGKRGRSLCLSVSLRLCPGCSKCRWEGGSPECGELAGRSGPPGCPGPSRARRRAAQSWGSAGATIGPLRPPLGLPLLPPTPATRRDACKGTERDRNHKYRAAAAARHLVEQEVQAESRGWCFLRVPRTLPWAGDRGGCQRPGQGSGGRVRTRAERAATRAVRGDGSVQQLQPVRLLGVLG